MLSYLEDAALKADLADWVTVAAYCGAAILTARAAASRRARRHVIEGLFWRASTAALVLLGINELLDLQTLLTALGKAMALAQGWYEERRIVQFVFVLLIAAGAAVLLAAIFRRTRRSALPVRVALAGFVFIALFVLLRAASFHHVDSLLGGGWKSFNYGSLQEMAGIVIVGLAAIAYRRTGRGRRRRR